MPLGKYFITQGCHKSIEKLQVNFLIEDSWPESCESWLLKMRKDEAILQVTELFVSMDSNHSPRYLHWQKL